jgi:hypothetical protein
MGTRRILSATMTFAYDPELAAASRRADAEARVALRRGLRLPS